MARRQGAFEDLMVFASKLPWQLGLGIAVAAASFLIRSRSGALYKRTQADPATALASMRWGDFERLVGEAFRLRGYAVTGFGGRGPDGGVDLGLSKNGQRFLVQCKHWRNRQVGVTVVRELN